MRDWIRERWTAGRRGSFRVLRLFFIKHLWATIILIISFIIGTLMHWQIGGVQWGPFDHWLHVEDILGTTLKTGWPLFILAIFWGWVASLRTRYFYSRYDLTSLGVGSKFYISLIAGIWEELGFRSVFIFTSMIFTWIANKLTLGLWLWLIKHLGIPLTNLVTLWQLKDLWGSVPALLAAGMLSAASSFMEGHEYQGFLGKWNSYYIGLFLLYITLNYGLLVAMILHFSYDFILLTTEHVIHDMTT